MIPTEQWDTKTQRDRDIWIAKNIMGFTIENRPSNDIDLSFSATYFVYPNGNKFKPVAFWSPSTNIAAAMEAEDKIMQLGVHNLYAFSLAEVISMKENKHISDVSQFELIHASAADRCKAMYLTFQFREDNIHG